MTTDYADDADLFIRAHPLHPWSICMRGAIARVAMGLQILAEIFESMKLGLPNQSVERTGMSRSGHVQFHSQRRLIPVAHLFRSATLV